MPELDGDELLETCDQCGGTSRGTVWETVVGDRVEWGVSMRCPACGAALEMHDAGEIGGVYRAALVAHAGLVTVHADPAVNRPLRPRLLAVFRRYGTSLPDAVTAYTSLTGDGITGTPGQSRLLANRLTAAGATVTQRAEPPG